MVQALNLRLNAETCRTLDAATIAGAGAVYTSIGTAIDHPARQILLQNYTDATLWFSFNGVDNHFPLLSNALFVLDITANKTFSEGFYLGEGKRLYCMQLGVPTTGSVYFTVFYGE